MQGTEDQKPRRFHAIDLGARTPCLALLVVFITGCGGVAAPDLGVDAADLGTALDSSPESTLHQPCSPASPCNAGEQCSFDLDSDWWCVPIGLAALDMGCTSDMTSTETWSLCMDGLFCDLIVPMPERIHPIVCRPPCVDTDECGAGERCVDAATPGPGGLCRASECDYDGVITTPVWEACMAWEFLGAAQANQDVLVPISERVTAGESCAEPFAFCGQHERLGVCDGDSVCRSTCRTVDDCSLGEECSPATVSSLQLESFDMFTIYSSQNLTLSTCREAS